MEVNTVKQSYYNERRNDAEVIQVLTAISVVSGRLARNMSILAVRSAVVVKLFCNTFG